MRSLCLATVTALSLATSSALAWRGAEPVEVTLHAGQSGVVFGRAGDDLVLVSQRRGGAWRDAAGHPHSTRDLARPASEATTDASGEVVASMRLSFDEAADDTLTVRLSDGSEMSPENGALEVLSAGWLDLDGDGRVEAFVDLAEPGASCCATTHVAHRDVQGEWRWSAHTWGRYAYGPSLDDLDDDGVVEWVSGDADVWWASGPATVVPLAISHFDHGEWRVVTGAFRDELARHARRLATITDDSAADALASLAAERRLLGAPMPASTLRAHAARVNAGERTHGLDAWMCQTQRDADVYARRHRATLTPRAGRGTPPRPTATPPRP